MVRLIKKKRNEDFIADTQPPQKAIMYYGMKAMTESSDINNDKEYQFFFTIYRRGENTIDDILKKDINPDKVFKATSRDSLKSEIQSSDFLTKKDFGILNKMRDDKTKVMLGYILEPTYSMDRDKWDYAEVYIDMNNNIYVKWRH